MTEEIVYVSVGGQNTTTYHLDPECRTLANCTIKAVDKHTLNGLHDVCAVCSGDWSPPQKTGLSIAEQLRRAGGDD